MLQLSKSKISEIFFFYSHIDINLYTIKSTSLKYVIQ